MTREGGIIIMSTEIPLLCLNIVLQGTRKLYGVQQLNTSTVIKKFCSYTATNDHQTFRLPAQRVLQDCQLQRCESLTSISHLRPAVVAM